MGKVEINFSFRVENCILFFYEFYYNFFKVVEFFGFIFLFWFEENLLVL